MTDKPSIESLRDILRYTKEHTLMATIDLSMMDRAITELEALRAENEALKARAEEAEKERHELSATSAKRLAGLNEALLLASEANTRADALAARVEILETCLGALSPHSEGYCWCFPGKSWDPTKPEDEHTGECREARAALNSTPSADLEAHDARVRREVLEGAWERMGHAPDPHDPGFFVCNHITVDRWYALRAAILGTAPQPSTENTAPREEETK